MYKLTIYTRELDYEAYPFGLATAVHLTLEKDGERVALNHNYGILFAKGEISSENNIIPLGVENPVAFRMEDGFIGIAGRRIRDLGFPYEADEGQL